MQANTEHEILARLTTVCSAERRRAVLGATGRGLLGGSAIAVALGLVNLALGAAPLFSTLLPDASSWLVRWALLPGAAVVALLAGPSIAAWRAARRRPDRHAAAAAVDRHYGLDDRTRTALVFLEKTDRKPLEQMQIADCAERLAGIDPRAVGGGLGPLGACRRGDCRTARHPTADGPGRRSARDRSRRGRDARNRADRRAAGCRRADARAPGGRDRVAGCPFGRGRGHSRQPARRRPARSSDLRRGSAGRARSKRRPGRRQEDPARRTGANRPRRRARPLEAPPHGPSLLQIPSPQSPTPPGMKPSHPRGKTIAAFRFCSRNPCTAGNRARQWGSQDPDGVRVKVG